MTNHSTLFRKIMQFVRDSHIRFHDRRILVTFVWALVGLIMSGRPHFSHWLPFRPDNTKAASKARQFSRWLHNEKINPLTLYHALVKRLVADWSGRQLYLALDTTQLWSEFVIVRVSLVYCYRAIPLTWCVRRGGSASVAPRVYCPLLEKVASFLPKDGEIVLLADRGFNHVDLLRTTRQLGWHFRLRLKRDTHVLLANRRLVHVRDLIPSVGHAHCYTGVHLTKQRFGPIDLVVAHVKLANASEVWAIASDQPVGRHTFDEYGSRFDIEENFLDDKSGAFNLEDSRLRDAQAISRLCFIYAVATCYLVSTGVAVVTLGLRQLVDTHWRRGLSYLKIGWRWCQYALGAGRWLHNFLWLPPEPAPEPAIASWIQFHKPRFSVEKLEYP